MDRHYGWVIVAVGAVITCLAAGAMFALPVYLQPMADDTGWSRAGISAAMTVGFITMGFAGFAWGTLSDRIGARPVVLIASIMLGLGLVIASRATSLLVFQIAYGGLVGGAGGAFFAPLMSTTIGWFDKHRSLAVSLVSIGGGVAPMVVTPFASVLIGAYGWRSTMLMIALGASAIIIPLTFLIRQAPALDAPISVSSELVADPPQRAPASAPSSAGHSSLFSRPPSCCVAPPIPAQSSTPSVMPCSAAHRRSPRPASTASKALPACSGALFSG